MEILEHGWDEADFHQRFLPIVNEMIANRGWIINSYSQIEFLLGDLIAKLRQFDEYADLREKPIPFGIDKRIERIRAACELGPIQKHAGNIIPLLGRIVELEETRHFFSHGFMSVHIERGGKRMAMHMRRYVPPKKGELETKSELLVFPEQMATAREQWARFAQSALLIIRDVYADLGLEAHDVTKGEPPVLGA